MRDYLILSIKLTKLLTQMGIIWIERFFLKATVKQDMNDFLPLLVLQI